MRSLRTLLAAAAFPAAAVAGDPSPYGTVHNVVDPPGWFGPGPDWHKWREPGPGANWSYYRLAGGPYLTYPFGYPAAVGSFWTNGFSLYGPPVPTYGPTPGTFGGATADKWFFRSTPPPVNAAFPGLGWGGYRSPSPRPVHPSVSVYPAVPGPFPVPPPVVASPPTNPACFRVAVRLPDRDAVVWVNKTETRQTGADRVYESPPLTAGGKYKYELVAQWTENGEKRAESRVVTASAGDSVVVDFTRPAETAAATP